MKRVPFRIALTGAILLIGTVLTTEPTTAQLIQRYTSQQEIATATEVARDSIGQDAILIAIATAGEIDLSPLGFPETIDGFREEDGTSSIWAYQFATPDAEEEGAVVIVNFNLFPQIRQVERGNLYGVSPRELVVDAQYSGSDQFAAQLRTNNVFNEFRNDFPDMISDAIVLTWEPDEDLVSIPSGFPTAAPYWAIFYNTEYWEEGDSSMVCFVSSGSGEAFCQRSGAVSGVEERPAFGGTTLDVAVNPVVRDRSELSLNVDLSEGADLLGYGLYDLNGRLVVDFIPQLPVEIPSGSSFSHVVPVSDLTAGEYFIRLTDTKGSVTKKVIVE